MKIIQIQKPYSWLQWPVSLRHCKHPNLHVTAKFFGDTRLDIGAIVDKLERFKAADSINKFFYDWRPEIFDDLTYVLELLYYPAVMKSIHDSFALIKDTHPLWRPHITVDKGYWQKVKDYSLTPRSEGLTFGELELYLGNPDVGQGD